MSKQKRNRYSDEFKAEALYIVFAEAGDLVEILDSPIHVDSLGGVNTNEGCPDLVLMREVRRICQV